MSDFPWYRFYNETLTDRKMLRVCRDSGQPKAVVIGVWATLLALASESPDRGSLMISDDIPLTGDEIREETGLDWETFNSIIGPLAAYGLLNRSGECWSICNWQKRQPNSDSSTERVRKHRQKKQEETLPAADNETLQKRYSNVIDIDTDTDTDTEGEGERGASAPARPPTPAADFQPVPEAIKKQKDRRGVKDPEPALTAAAPRITQLLHQLTNYWPGEDLTPALVEQFGEVPDETALNRAVELWRLSGHKLTNWLGIADWYAQVRQKPDWTPQDRFRDKGGGRNQSAPTVSKPSEPQPVLY